MPRVSVRSIRGLYYDQAFEYFKYGVVVITIIKFKLRQFQHQSYFLILKKHSPTIQTHHTSDKHSKCAVFLGTFAAGETKVQLSFADFRDPCSVGIYQLFTFFWGFDLSTAQFNTFVTDDYYIRSCCLVLFWHFFQQRKRGGVPI